MSYPSGGLGRALRAAGSSCRPRSTATDQAQVRLRRDHTHKSDAPDTAEVVKIFNFRDLRAVNDLPSQIAADKAVAPTRERAGATDDHVRN